MWLQSVERLHVALDRSAPRSVHKLFCLTLKLFVQVSVPVVEVSFVVLFKLDNSKTFSVRVGLEMFVQLIQRQEEAARNVDLTGSLSFFLFFFFLFFFVG